MGRFDELNRRKARLADAAAEQRQAIAETARALRRPLGWADRGVALLAYAKARPVLVAAIAAAVVAVKPARALALGRCALSLWRGARTARALLALLQARSGGAA
ncbi:MAG TPA: YqjK family protein [Burkholderiales bacterium]|nr:YqjK family protein [Burkholderiales bacterium]